MSKTRKYRVDDDLMEIVQRYQEIKKVSTITAALNEVLRLQVDPESLGDARRLVEVVVDAARREVLGNAERHRAAA